MRYILSLIISFFFLHLFLNQILTRQSGLLIKDLVCLFIAGLYSSAEEFEGENLRNNNQYENGFNTEIE